MKTIFLPQLNKQIEVVAGSNLMKSLLAAGVPVASSCNGDGVCAKCRVHIQMGGFDATSPIGEVEKFLIEKFKLMPDERISCQVQVFENIEVRTTYW